MAERWGDVEDGDLEGPDAVAGILAGGGLPPRTVSRPDKDGVRTVVQYVRGEEGQVIKTTQQVKTVKKKHKVSKGALQRRKWRKFGECRGLPPGPEPNVTYTSAEVIRLELGGKQEQEQEVKENEAMLEALQKGSAVFVCRFCGETGHFTLKCPKRNEAQPRGAGAQVPLSQQSGAGGDGAEDKTGRYIPPSQRAGAQQGRSEYEETPSLRVTNLPDDCTEQDLHDLFRTVGPTSRIYLAKDRVTFESRGFAFVSYHSREDAERAIQRIDGHRYSNLVLRVEWAKPREERAGEK